ncbi:hypothetical protein AY601_0438 [Pedobacter cryoconitis]|uniref:Uncharacterized protein n=1 Tax=Pedobacter cryoconitis TaxID=188932 RepID=A0A127V7W2_9SPHI|nr:hypothetical protein AY601_0438 [Pedobacter cryoconitis]
MTKKTKLDLSSFEVLAENDKGALVGGFSTIISNPQSLVSELGSINANVGNCSTTNNCSGGNCTTTCGGH